MDILTNTHPTGVLLRALLTLLAFHANTGYGGCTERQANDCKQAVAEHALSSLKEGGKCQAKSFPNLEYTGVCRVTNYVEGLDYCCCVEDAKVLCCRYHYDWAVFWCNQDKDVVGQASTSFPRWLIVVVAIGLALILAISICCAVKYLRGKKRKRHEPPSSELLEPIAVVAEPEKTSPGPNDVFFLPTDSSEGPSTVVPPGNSSAQPSAPPREEDEEECDSLGELLHSPGGANGTSVRRSDSEPRDMMYGNHNVPPYSADDHPMFRSQSVPQPPPTYDESLHHSVVN